MRVFHSKTIIFSLIILFLCQGVKADDSFPNKTDVSSISSDSIEQIVNRKYQERLAKRQALWIQLQPSLGVIQYAGNIGFISAGVGWDYGKNERWETQLLLGYLPAFVMSDDMFTLTLRENLVPWNVFVYHNLSISPAVFTFTVNTVMNHEFWYKETDRYGGEGYYRFSTALRFHIGLGGRINLHIPEKKQKRAEQISLYYEVSTYDLAIISAVPNSQHRLRDILCLGLGLQYKFF